LSWLDIVIIIILALSALGGLRKGLIQMVFTLAGVSLGIFLAGRFYETAAGWLTFITNTDLANVVAFILILLVVLVVCLIIAHFLAKLANITLMGVINRLGGALFGIFLASIIIAAILAIITKYTPWDVVVNSFIAKLLLGYFPLVLGLLPKSFQSIKDFFTTPIIT